MEAPVKKTRPLLCVVTSDRMTKSRVGTLERLQKHPRYLKYVKHTTKLMFHDEKNESKMGDKVLIKQCRPHSAHKRFELVKVVERGAVVEELVD